ncbi:hypothetical protein EVAR_17859_1 [Eumeta japonica]|uniref:Mariner Mos1 transposase n=1 Tax=Eumeta variegata TaxID=151549 RepID=A0A4C2AAN8_EUMVA|nr:hypothetical protein EVAR_17859_1 [Eumeta japonica]
MVKRQAPQTIAKLRLTRNELMLCVWCDWKGVLFIEFLQLGKTRDSDFYCLQLRRLKQKVEKRPSERVWFFITISAQLSVGGLTSPPDIAATGVYLHQHKMTYL